MKKQRITFSRIASFAVLVGLISMQAYPFTTASAAQITNRSLTLQAGSSGDGGSMPGGTVNHLFAFDVAGGNVGSVKFQYCTTAAPVAGGIDCDLPTGIDTTGASLGSEAGATGFTGIDNTTNGTVTISRASASSVSAGTLSYRLDDVVNPTTANTTFFVRISTHSSLDGTGAVVDSGTVTSATAEQIVLDGTMPESLVFCTGETIGLTGGVPDCGTATAGAISFNQLFSPTDTATATSQMAASTNAGAGYVITVNGPTLTSGSNTITPLSTSTASIKGVSQFGMNLVANTTNTSDPAVGAAVAPATNSTNYRGVPQTGYDADDTFTFISGDDVAASNNGGAGGSDAQIYTASYIVNVPGSQPAGTYTTTLTYICTPTF